MADEAVVQGIIDAELGGVKELDEDIFAYIAGIVHDTDSHGCDPETLCETVSGLVILCGQDVPMASLERV